MKIHLSLPFLPFLILFPLTLALAEEPLYPPAGFPAQEMRAELLSRQHVVLSCEQAARILSIEPDEGQKFSKGDLLVRFDCALQKAQLVRAQAQFKAAETKVEVHKRLSKLNASSRLEEGLAVVEAATAKAEMEIIQVHIHRCEIYAPFSGRVAERMAQAHQYVKTGDPLMEILDPSALEAVFLLPSQHLSKLSIGDAFHIRIDETSTTYSAVVRAIGARIDAMSQSVKVMGRIVGDHPELLPGMSGRATLNVAGKAP